MMEIYSDVSKKELKKELIDYIESNLDYNSKISEELKEVLHKDVLGSFCSSYSEVLDWLHLFHNIIISFEPAFTFSTKDHVAYFYKVYKINDNEGKLDLLFEDTSWMSSFKFAIDNIVKKIIEEKYI